jgi:hypothetical protein
MASKLVSFSIFLCGVFMFANLSHADELAVNTDASTMSDGECEPDEGETCLPQIVVGGSGPGGGVIIIGGGSGCAGCTGGGNSGGGGFATAGSVPDAPNNPVRATCRADSMIREAHAQEDGRYLRAQRYPNVPQTGSTWQVNFDDGGSEVYFWTGMSAPFGHAIPGTLRCP